MSDKYRVVRMGKFYYPQYYVKVLWIFPTWCYFHKSEYELAIFKSQKDAIGFIKDSADQKVVWQASDDDLSKENK